MYNYYAYPDKKRSRISQILILPKYQNAGHGAELTECVLRDVYQCPRTVDVTAESPSSEFIRLRDDKDVHHFAGVQGQGRAEERLQ